MSENQQFLLYTAPDGAVRVEVYFKDETVWLTQKALAELFGVKVPAVNKHLKNIFESGELDREATVSKMEIVRPEGAREVARENVAKPILEKVLSNENEIEILARIRDALLTTLISGELRLTAAERIAARCI